MLDALLERKALCQARMAVVDRKMARLVAADPALEPAHFKFQISNFRS